MDIKSDPSNNRASTLTDIRSRQIRESEHGASDKTKSKQSGSAEGYSVKLSPQAALRKQEQAKAFQIAKDTNPVREDKISQLKQQIENGTYKPDSGKIADGILREAIRDYLASDQ